MSAGVATAVKREAGPFAGPAQPGPTVAAIALILAVGVAAWGWLFHAEASAALRIWETSTAYGHCFFVIPIALYLAWDRRDAIRRTSVAPLPSAALLVVPLALGWLAAERVG